MSYAEVITDIKIQSLDRKFTYEIPSDMSIERGMLVKIPFGKSNRPINAYVIDIVEKTDVDLTLIKKIIGPSSDKPVISDKRLKLALWMKDEYRCTLSSCIQCIAPKITSEKTEYTVSLHPNRAFVDDAVALIRKNAVKQLNIIEYLKNNSDVRLSTLKTECSGFSMSALNVLCEKGIVVKSPYRTYRGNFTDNEFVENKTRELTQEQQNVISTIENEFAKEKRKPILIHGVTGSGKTEIYIRIIEKVLKQGKQAILLVPEISLTQQTVERLFSRFGSRIALTHSSMNDGERFDQWTRAQNGLADIMIGPRSAIFTPFDNLGVVIIDEEHESSYRSEKNPQFDARQVAIKLSALYGASVIFGSATPSIESYKKALNGEYLLCELTKRVNNTYPDVYIVDMRKELSSGNRSVFSGILKQKLTETLSRRKQAILFLNRRGYSTFVSCRSCGYVMKCNNCDVNYTYHKSLGKLTCHYCGETISVPEKCPKCSSENIRYFGLGTEKLVSETQKIFPEAKILRMDVDTTRKKNSHSEILKTFRDHKADILIGTQMISKGLDFENVDLVGIICADMSLNTGNYRSTEVTFQLVNQVSGRAGRSSDKGDVIIQTYTPDNYSIVYAAENDYKKFFSEELSFRRQLKYPPFYNIYQVIFEGNVLNEVIGAIKYYSEILFHYNKKRNFIILGPSACTVTKIKNKYRWQIIIKHDNDEKLKNFVHYCLDIFNKNFPQSGMTTYLFFNPVC